MMRRLLLLVVVGEDGQQAVLGLGQNGFGVADDAEDAEGATRGLADAIVVGDEALLVDQLVGEQ